MNFAREGLSFIAVAALSAVGMFAFAAYRRSWSIWLLAFAIAIIALWVAYFFRDPERQGERGDGLVVSPADGRVVQITNVAETAFFHGPATRISIFMNVFNVHVNRFPVNGTVQYLQYSEGKFLNAANDKASLENEQMSVGIEAGKNKVLVRQIAGLIARRIANYAKLGDTVSQGARMGLIRFGSRVDDFVPPTSTIRVKEGDLPVAGTTVLAVLPE
ncbi:MAG: phosphatidylserine decarboxylase family protein [Gemmatimonadaceae bacterium]